ncbi:MULTISPECIES: hypothetical protein [Prochlorococcus]|uniref:Uncharacterized conserved protein n=1 Tax=Prochlorococcus marinus (strain SARG / CCMP1375 / SS120) TaxID=167539 RepID=Q7VAI6_PROMA|nr:MULTISPECIES: hypothetical protein [Prochlorococcus]AAQ00520.1 Uncharacterized conserved protein [Prochlorococcus marinus subsp. marinus str. CCMP1375]KGG10310.1 hypothetical protein EV04_1976 [Prochlorococcus marinus str. LG]KGG22603.1 hypothetical protein EV08_0018 [Prochlorococcus marinus str. SS2]KGG24244.1 hypothetical protein EV09_0851 [Prochlorococcus marinus str. SS35]KGG33143.1 hypothetical protein EV10_0776 [Prochlorococcus marinus str. SS51]
MYLKSLDGCLLAIGSYPAFQYDARGGGGSAVVIKSEKNNIKYIKFAPETFSIPALTSKTTKFLGLPLLIGLKIQMYLEILEGTINLDSGEVLLNFESRFIFSIFTKFHFPSLFVKTCLKTGTVKSDLYQETGNVVQQNGVAKLVGVACIPKTGNKALDLFLGLPNEALAILQCEINIES